MDAQQRFDRLHWLTQWRMRKWGHNIRIDQKQFLYICSKCRKPHIDEPRGRNSMGDGVTFYCVAA